MRRLQYIFITIFAVWLQGQAQIRYEYWLDGNRSSIQRGNLILGEQTISVDEAGMPYPGLHFLNILPYDESGEPGVWQCIAFLMPEGWPDSNEATMMEYWVTGYDRQPHRQPYAGTAVTLDIDAANYSPGLHFLNYRTLNARGEGGSWHVIGFLMPEGWPDSNEATMMEYWVTGYDRQPKRLPFEGGEVTFDIDISQMSYGLHFLNYRTQNERGEFGAWKQIRFYVNNGIYDVEPVEGEFWIDDNEVKTIAGVMPGTVTLQMDLNELEHGEHTFNFRGKNFFGSYGENYSTTFLFLDRGDANGDCVVNVSDVTATINYILGKNPEKFNFSAADVTGDGSINVSDVTGIINIILGK